MNQKETVRFAIKERIRKMSQLEKENESQEVCKLLKKILKESEIETLVTYIPLPDEIDIREVSDWAKTENKKVIVVGNSPNPEELSLEEYANCYCLVPGRAFTKDGKRIGR